MLFSKYFLPLIKENPKEAAIVSHSLMLKCAMIRQNSAGIYTFLPMGLKVLQNISNIIRDELNKTGACEILMSTIQTATLWKESGRYDDYGKEMLRITDRHQKELLYGPTNEEQISQIIRDNTQSYKDFPLNLYQIQWKFRDEVRPRFGLMRGREFLMKDAYSFDLTKEEGLISYKKMFVCYLKIFERLGLQAIPMQADTGPIGGDNSHEFIILANTGESEVYCDKRILELNLFEKLVNYEDNLDNIIQSYTKLYAVTEDKFNENDNDYLKNKEYIIQKRGIEVGHVFWFADKYSSPMGLKVQNAQGDQVTPLMGSYGIGISRLLGAIIEATHDAKGIVWHKAIAPFLVMINPLTLDKDVYDLANKIYQELISKGIDTMLYDKADTIGTKLNTADLLGFPYQINIGSKGLVKRILEFKIRKTGQIIEIPMDSNIDYIITLINAN